MKTLYLGLIFLFSVTQTANGPVEKAMVLFKQNNFAEISKWLAKTVDLSIKDEGNLYSQQQAKMIITNFFQKNEVVNVKLVHKVDSNPEYQVGVLVLTCKTKTYRTTISFRQINNVYQIDELHIEEEKVN